MAKPNEGGAIYKSMAEYWSHHPSPTREDRGQGPVDGADVGSRLADQFLQELRRAIIPRERKGSHS